jgi:hypothetical protein
MLDVHGNRVFGPDGVVACNLPTPTFVSQYDLKIDTAGNAIVGAQYIDTVSQTDSVFITKISPNGTHLWGLNGRTPGEGFSPVICVTPSNDIIVASRAGARIWRLRPDGSQAWASPDTIDPRATNCLLINTNTSDFIVVYFKPGGNFQYGNLYAMKYDSSGAKKWTNPVTVSTQTAVVYEAIRCVPDGQNGFFCALTSHSAINQDGYAQHIDADGNTLWGADGMVVSSDSSILKFVSGLAYAADQKNLYVLESVTDLNQNFYGIKLQKIDSAGNPLFGTAGIQTQPVDSSHTDGGVVLEPDGIAYIYTNDSNRIKADKIAFDGHKIWEQRFACTQTSSKLNPSVGLYKNNQFVAVWEDDRDNTSGIYAQNFVDSTGTDTTVSVTNIYSAHFNAFLYPNPSGENNLGIEINNTRPQNISVQITDMQGRQVYYSYEFIGSGLNMLRPGLSRLSKGMYLVKLQSADNSQCLKWICGD